jgi:hypothetical protein
MQKTLPKGSTPETYPDRLDDMRGTDTKQASMLSLLTLAKRVPPKPRFG